MDESNAVKLRREIALTMASVPSASADEIARNVHARESRLVAAWARERLALLVREQMRKSRPPPGPSPYQMFLEGFETLSERLPLPGRGGVTLAAATIVDLRRSLKLTRLKVREKAQQTALLIREMGPYTKTRRGLTVERYCELRAAGVPSHVPK